VNFGAFVQGVSDVGVRGLSVFPNPTHNQWTISSKGANITLVEVFDLQGKLILDFVPNGPVTAIDASTFDEGIYFSRITTNSGTSGFKLLKE